MGRREVKGLGGVSVRSFFFDLDNTDQLKSPTCRNDANVTQTRLQFLYQYLIAKENSSHISHCSLKPQKYNPPR